MVSGCNHWLTQTVKSPGPWARFHIRYCLSMMLKDTELTYIQFHFICLHCRKSTSVTTAVSPSDDSERLLRERRPNGMNTEELLQLLENTRDARRSWIQDKSPSITEILSRYPRLFDVNGAVCNVPSSSLFEHALNVNWSLPCSTHNQRTTELIILCEITTLAHFH